MDKSMAHYHYIKQRKSLKKLKRLKSVLMREQTAVYALIYDVVKCVCERQEE